MTFRRALIAGAAIGLAVVAAAAVFDRLGRRRSITRHVPAGAVDGPAAPDPWSGAAAASPHLRGVVAGARVDFPADRGGGHHQRRPAGFAASPVVVASRTHTSAHALMGGGGNASGPVGEGTGPDASPRDLRVAIDLRPSDTRGVKP